MGFLDYNIYMDVIDYFLKSIEKRKERIDNYTNWAYPYGQNQKKIVTQLLKELMPKEDKEIVVYNYLNCKQQFAPKEYSGPYEVSLYKIPKAIDELSKQFNFKNKDNLYKCLALVEADSKIDEALNYPSANDLTKRAEELKQILK